MPATHTLLWNRGQSHTPIVVTSVTPAHECDDVKGVKPGDGFVKITYRDADGSPGDMTWVVGTTPAHGRWIVAVP